MNQALLTLVAIALFLAPLGADDKSNWDILERKSADPRDRMAAAKSIADQAKSEGTCEKAASGMIPVILDADTYPGLKLAILEAVVSCDNDGVRKVVAKKVGHGKPEERAWILHLARALSGPEIDKAVLEKGLTDDKIENRIDAAAILAQHKSPDARAAFEAILKTAKDTELLGPIVTQLALVYDGTADWPAFEERMLALIADKNESLRRAALAAIVRGKNPARIDLFTVQLASNDWSTRALSLEYLEGQRTKPAVAAIIAQLANEPKGTRMNAECVMALIRSTGMNFADLAADWAAWWQKNEATFEFPKPPEAPATPTPDDGSKPPPKAPARKFENETKVAVQFYGIEVESKRVCFVVDLSLSMLEKMKEGDDAGTMRFDVAKRELKKIIDGLEPGTLFNIVTFCGDVDAWLDSIEDLPVGLGGKKPEADKRPSPNTPAEKPKDEKQKHKEAEAQKKLDDQLRAKAQKYVDKLEPCEGTNIYDALERAFEDKKIDTIFFMTDGEPNFGREVDPVQIREAVQRWNITRKIKISTISIGTDRDLVKHLAADSGGVYRFFK